MTFADLGVVVRQRWKIITGVVLLGLVIALVATFFTPKRYEAGASLYIASQGGGSRDLQTAYQGGLLSQERVKSYIELVQGTRVSDEVKSRLALPDSSEDIAKEITAASTTDTVVIQITANTRSADTSAQIANTAADVLVDLVSQVEAPGDRNQQPAVVARVVQRAAPDGDPASPNLPLDLALGLIAGLVLGLAAALVVHRFDTRIKNAEQAAAIVGAPVIGTIPQDPEIDRDRLPVVSRPRSPIAESFRSVRTNLRYADVSGENLVVAVTSSVPGEGKSTSACNIALALATSGVRVALVEADLRRPRISSYLGLEGTVGLSTVLSRQVSLDQAMQIWRGTLPVLTSGELPHNPSELLGSARMGEVLAELRARFEAVVLDCAPLRLVTDSAVLAPFTDGVIVVSRNDKTDATDLTRAVDDLRKISARILGTLVVGEKPSRSNAYGQYGDYVDPRPSAEPARRPSPHPQPGPRTDVTAATETTRAIGQAREAIPPRLRDRGSSSNTAAGVRAE